MYIYIYIYIYILRTPHYILYTIEKQYDTIKPNVRGGLCMSYHLKHCVVYECDDLPRFVFRRTSERSHALQLLLVLLFVKVF